ncbi:FixH family protein [Gracilibacillus caseinilyticus]|uniref:FixH family protein n=1 Tax=Gracilibacillus caseinilyticus TaxID=2932256 RepID=A0ABY4EY12_9BACI|nr:FixH family protein [Gracilibacillus caseinilyticus]UOQ49300.1 FixH family protein [Gracilibacillus caseinilyticus]
MKKIVMITFLTALLSACSANQLNEDAADQYHTEQPFTITIDLPSNIEANTNTPINVTLQQNNTPADNVQNISAELWMPLQPEVKTEVALELQEPGVYHTDYTFAEDGIYYLQVRAESEHSDIMPIKRIIVGELSEEEQAFLDRQKKESEEDHSSHH